MLSLLSTASLFIRKVTRGHWEGSHYIKNGTGLRRWSKWGNGNDYNIDLDREAKPEEEWFCQSCGEVQPKELTPYRWKYEDMLLRVCAKCYKEGCVVLKSKFSLQILELSL